MHTCSLHSRQSSSHLGSSLRELIPMSLSLILQCQLTVCDTLFRLWCHQDDSKFSYCEKSYGAWMILVKIDQDHLFVEKGLLEKLTSRSVRCERTENISPLVVVVPYAGVLGMLPANDNWLFDWYLEGALLILIPDLGVWNWDFLPSVWLIER